MAYVFKDLPNQNAPATLASVITSGATTIVLTTGTGTLLPSPTGGDVAACRIEQELITYDTRTTDTLTGVTRGVGGTTAAAHSAGKQVRNTAPADFFNNAGGGGIPDQIVGAGGTVSADGSGAFSSKIYLQTGGAGPILIDSQLIDQYGGGITFKSSVRAATTTNGTLATAYENGDTVDGVTLATGDRILLKDQTSGAENGVYIVAASGAPTRATDANSASEVYQGFCIFVREGTVNANRVYVHTTAGAITLNTTPLTFAQFGGSGTVTSVALTVPTGLSVSGSPITGAGTLAVTESTQGANTVKAGPTSGGAATPAYRSLVAADLPNTAVTPGSYTSTDLTVDAQGRITAASNGSAGGGAVATDAIWDAAGDLAVGTGANTAAKLAMGTALEVLRVNAGATALEWAAPSGGGTTDVLAVQVFS